MVHLRHILHPVRSAKSLYRRVSAYGGRKVSLIYRRLALYRLHHLDNIRRGQRDLCWCGGALAPFKWQASFGVCLQCGCYVNRRPPLEDDLPKLYAFETYWHTRQQVRGYPIIEQRPSYDRSQGRLGRWLEIVKRYGLPRGQVIEVGCAHGTLLAELKQRGYECIGVETDEQLAAWSRKNTAVDIRVGFFPGVPLPNCDIFIALDVIEHSPCPDDFMREAGRLLSPAGIAIIQAPIDRHESEPPFGEFFEYAFDDLEHMYVFTPESIRKLADTAGLEIIGEATGAMEGDVTVFRRKR